MRCVLVGNYGVGNLGDEALKDYFSERFPEVDWVVVGSDVPRLPFGLRSLFRPWWRTIITIRSSDAVVFGGGSLFTDIESIKAPLLWGWHACVASMLRKKMILAFQGIGPFRTGLGEWITRWVCRRATHISVRDSLSYDRVKSWKLNTEIVQSFDPVFSEFINKKVESCTQDVISIIPRNNSCVEGLLQCHDERDRTMETKIISMKADDAREQEVCLALAKQTGGVVITVNSLDDLLGALSTSTHVITARYHGALAALALGIPYIPVSIHAGDKLDSLTFVQDLSKEQLLLLVEKGEEALSSLLK